MFALERLINNGVPSANILAKYTAKEPKLKGWVCKEFINRIWAILNKSLLSQQLRGQADGNHDTLGQNSRHVVENRNGSFLPAI